MAAHGKALRVIVLSGAVAGLVLLCLHAAFSGDDLPVVPATCTALPSDMALLGGPLNVAQVETASLAEMQNAPQEIPRVPFGQSNAEWIALKKTIEPGDQLYRFRTPITGGLVVMRERCIVSELTE